MYRKPSVCPIAIVLLRPRNSWLAIVEAKRAGSGEGSESHECLTTYKVDEIWGNIILNLKAEMEAVAV